MRRTPLILMLLLLGCGDDDGTSDLGVDVGLEAGFDAGLDANRADEGLNDAGLDAAPDAPMDARGDDASEDAGMATGFGELVGECDRLGPEFDSETPSFFSVRLDFMDDGYDEPEERPLLTEDAVRLLEADNAGGSSIISEAFALEVLVRCEGADLSATETEITYDPAESDKTDFRVTFDERAIGVSVVRAFSFPLGSDYPVSEAERVLSGKLEGILESSANVSPEFAWDKQILAVLAPDDMPLESVMSAWESFDEALRADTILYVIVTDGDDEAIYLNR